MAIMYGPFLFAGHALYI